MNKADTAALRAMDRKVKFVKGKGWKPVTATIDVGALNRGTRRYNKHTFRSPASPKLQTMGREMLRFMLFSNNLGK